MASEATLRNNVATWLNQYKGCVEGGAGHKEILAVFNDSGLCTRYKMTVNDAWCAAATSAAFIACGLASIFPCVECSCANMVSLAKTAGIWVEDDAYTPKVGDVILYDWDDSGSGDCTGTPDHVGIVQAISGTTLTVIEGNKSDTVGTRSVTINGRYIRGYITPDYASAATADEATTFYEGWLKAADGKRWWYQFADGSYADDGWHYLHENTGNTDNWYAFDGDGYMETGKVVLNGKTYFLCDDEGSSDYGACMVSDATGALFVCHNWDQSAGKYVF